MRSDIEIFSPMLYADKDRSIKEAFAGMEAKLLLILSGNIAPPVRIVLHEPFDGRRNSGWVSCPLLVLACPNVPRVEVL
jgi:hypothetical protein